ncbi:MAG TPA: MarR family transcriptional regulator [Thermoanaerobaculia bacterium]|jgi:DNA-binding MarR family transcriptional regulator|nr:MarR family transcriptional regulator [Thermoanaerobaculia bacterium]
MCAAAPAETLSPLPIVDSLTALAPVDPTLARDAAELQRSLSDLVRVVQFRDRDRICCHDISVTQCYALEELIRRGPLTLNELAQVLYLDKSTASRVVDSLERKGYATRSPHPADGRALLLAATPAGRTLCERIEGDLVLEAQRLLVDIEPEARRAMALLLGRLARAVESRTSCGVDGCSTC